MGTLVVKTSTSPITMKTSIALAVVALALSANAKPDFDSCPGVDNTPFVNPFHLSVKPDPVVLKKGEQVKIHFDATLVAELPAGAKISLKLVKEGVPIPCLPEFQSRSVLAIMTLRLCWTWFPLTCAASSHQLERTASCH